MLSQHRTSSPRRKLQQFNNANQSKLINQCQQVIKQLQTQLEYSLKKNQQKDLIIKILTQQKQFYEQQSKKTDQKVYPKLKQQLNFNQGLINGLKQHNKELTQKNIKINQQNNDLWQKNKQKDHLLKILQQNIQNVQEQKNKLQKQWTQTLMCVKKKIFEIQKQNYNTMDKNMTQKYVNAKKAYSKDNYLKKYNVNENKKQLKNGSTQQKVKEIIKQIDQKLLNYQFLDMIQSKNIRKNMERPLFYQKQANKQNINSTNILNQHLNLRRNIQVDEIKEKKIPILKLSQLQLKDEKQRQNKYSKSLRT